MKELTMNKSTTNPQKYRFNYLKSMFKQAPLSASDFKELITLAKKFDKKMAAYLETNS